MKVILILKIMFAIFVSQAASLSVPQCGQQATMIARCDGYLSVSQVTSQDVESSSSTSYLNSWQQSVTYVFPNVLYNGDKLRFYCKSIYNSQQGKGGFKAQVNIAGYEYYTGDKANSFSLNTASSQLVSANAQMVIEDSSAITTYVYYSDPMNSKAKWVWSDIYGNVQYNQTDVFDFTFNCFTCFQNCLNCTSTVNCQTCQSGYFLLTNGNSSFSCVSSTGCGETKYADGGNQQIGGKCASCVTGCKNCTNSSICQACYPPLLGGLCEITNFCGTPSGNPCKNGGTCSLSTDLTDFVCNCKHGYSGKDCSLKSDICKCGNSFDYSCCNHNSNCYRNNFFNPHHCDLDNRVNTELCKDTTEFCNSNNLKRSSSLIEKNYEVCPTIANSTSNQKEPICRCGHHEFSYSCCSNASSCKISFFVKHCSIQKRTTGCHNLTPFCNKTSPDFDSMYSAMLNPAPAKAVEEFSVCKCGLTNTAYSCCSAHNLCSLSFWKGHHCDTSNRVANSQCTSTTPFCSNKQVDPELEQKLHLMNDLAQNDKWIFENQEKAIEKKKNDDDASI